MLVTVSDGDQFDFVFDENDYGFYKIFIKVTNINDLIVFQSEQMYHKAFESFWVIFCLSVSEVAGFNILAVSSDYKRLTLLRKSSSSSSDEQQSKTA